MLVFLYCLNHENKLNTVISGGSKGGARDAPPPPPPGPNSFNFMQFLGKFGKFVCWRPPRGSWCPLLGEILDPPLVISHTIFNSMYHYKFQFVLKLIQLVSIGSYTKMPALHLLYHNLPSEVRKGSRIAKQKRIHAALQIGSLYENKLLNSFR